MPVNVIVPPLSATADTLTLMEWYKREGDMVLKDEPLFMVETDKATLDVESPASGRLLQVSAKAGDSIVSLSRIAVIVAEGESLSDVKASPPVAPKPPVKAPPPIAKPAVAPLERRVQATQRRIFISPRAKKLAEERRFDWRKVIGTGPEGAIVERDVHTSLNKLQVPITLTTETNATELVALRERLKGAGVAVAYDDLILLILARALREVPKINASQEGDAHIGITVDVDDDLTLAVVRNVDKKSLREIAKETLSLREAAKAGDLTVERTQVATLALTNLGMFGIDAFTPVIATPDCPLVGIGRIKTLSQPSDVTQRFSVWVSLTFDPRLVRAGTGARFLQSVAATIENPTLALV